VTTTTPPIAGSTPTWSPAKAAKDGGKPGELSKDDFMKLLVAQLRYQDPSAPADPSAFMNQSTQLANMEQMAELAKITGRLLTAEQTRSAAGFIGQTVTWKEGDQELTGVVGSVRLGSDDPLLVIGKKEVALSAVTGLSAAAAVTPPATPAAAPPAATPAAGTKPDAPDTTNDTTNDTTEGKS
jgi:flagellar basal-body rod modification protein FlgD